MKNVHLLKYNAYCTGDDGLNYRAVAIAGKWRLCVQNRRMPTDWDFVNNKEYDTVYDALQDVDIGGR